MMVNPRKRKRKTVKRKSPARKTVARARPAKRRVAVKRRKSPTVRRRRNPIVSKGIVDRQLTPALTAASGALMLDMIWGFAPIPETVKAGPLRYLAKGVGALALGMIANNVVNRKIAEQLSTGALTVIMHGAMRDVAQRTMPNVQLGYYNAGYPAGVGEYVNGLGEVGAYIPDSSVSPYLADNNLSSPFAGQSTAQEVEQRMTRECDAG